MHNIKSYQNKIYNQQLKKNKTRNNNRRGEYKIKRLEIDRLHTQIKWQELMLKFNTINKLN